MNILPHKSWHVRTKKNIARVRKDEAKAAEEEKEKQRRIALAAQEARTNLLRERAKDRFKTTCAEELPSTSFEEASGIQQGDGHVNFFQDIEEGVKQKYQVNEEHEVEKKEEQEEYEKKIGYLTFLGQNSLEHSKQRPWYEDISRSSTSKGTGEEIESKEKLLKLTKLKDFHDPLKDIRKYLHVPGIKEKLDRTASTAIKRQLPDETSASRPHKKLKKSKKTKKSKKSKKHKSKKSKRKREKHQDSGSIETDSEVSEYESDGSYEKRKQENLTRLRAERMEREREEGRKAERLMAKLRGETLPEEKPQEEQISVPRTRQKYNSQFNPHLARQNLES